MPSFLEHVRDHLLADGDVAAAFAKRIFPRTPPPYDPTSTHSNRVPLISPYALLTRVTGRSELNIDGLAGMKITTVQIDVVSLLDETTCQDGADKILLALAGDGQNWPALLNATVWVSSLEPEDERELHQAPRGRGERWIYRISRDFAIVHEEPTS